MLTSFTPDEISDLEDKFWKLEEELDADWQGQGLFFARIMGGPKIYARKLRDLAAEIFERDNSVYVRFHRCGDVILSEY